MGAMPRGWREIGDAMLSPVVFRFFHREVFHFLKVKNNINTQRYTSRSWRERKVANLTSWVYLEAHAMRHDGTVLIKHGNGQTLATAVLSALWTTLASSVSVHSDA